MRTVFYKQRPIVILTGCVSLLLFFIFSLSDSHLLNEGESRAVLRAARGELVVYSSKEEHGFGAITHEPRDEEERKREFIKEMMLHAWYSYRNYTWGYNELHPSSRTPNNQAIFGGEKMAATIVDAADTLWIMGLRKEYKQARDFIYDNFTIGNAVGTLSVFETNIRFVGGFVALRGLTGEEFYTEKAREVAEALLPAFDTPTGIAYSNVDVKTKTGSNYGWVGGNSILSEFGSLHLEFMYLSHLTGNSIFADKVKKIRDVLDAVAKPDGLYTNYYDPRTGKATGPQDVSIGAMGDSYYEYLIKSWMQTNFKDDQARRMYWEASAAIQRKLVFTSKSGLRFVAELKNGVAEKKMGHLACFCVGMFALEATYEKDVKRKEEDLGHTCHESYARSPTGLGPEMMYFNEHDDATSRKSENGYIQRPEVMEGIFYLWRLTGKQKYRDWMWDAVQSINTHLRVEHGFTGLHSVYDTSQGRDDVLQSYFFAETLKYAYLTFTENSVISLDEWVFNTEGHPFPVLKDEV